MASRYAAKPVHRGPASLYPSGSASPVSAPASALPHGVSAQPVVNKVAARMAVSENTNKHGGK